MIGYHLGQFNQQGEKRQPYDEDIRVPFIVRGPGVPANKTTKALALNIDLVRPDQTRPEHGMHC